MLLAPEVEHVSASVGGELSEALLQELDVRCKELEVAPRAQLVEGGRDPAEVRAWRELSLRWVGQSHMLEVPGQGEGTARVKDLFVELYAQRYGFVDKDRPIEVTSVNSRVTAPGLQSLPSRPPASVLPSVRQTWVHLESDRLDEEPQSVPLLHRSQIQGTLSGPAIIEEVSSTFWLPPGARLHPLSNGCARVETHA